MIKIFCFKRFSIVFLVLWYQADTLERAVQKVCRNLLKLWNKNVYVDLNGKRQNLETKQIKSHMFSYPFLTTIAICVFINFDIFYDTLGAIATFKGS